MWFDEIVAGAVISKLMYSVQSKGLTQVSEKTIILKKIVFISLQQMVLWCNLTSPSTVVGGIRIVPPP